MSAFTYPNMSTMPARVLARLLQGEAMTHQGFWLVAGTYRLSSPICDLRNKRGWNIQGSHEVVPTSDPTKRAAKVKRYYLPTEVINEAGELGQAFARAVIEWEHQAAGKQGSRYA